MLGRWMRRKKIHVVYPVVLFISIYAFLQLGYYYRTGFVPLRPLYSAEDEARRLLKYVTSYHYMCNNTVSLGNRSHFPICIDNDTGIDLESRGTVYSLWSPWEFLFERCLASNYSFDVNVITNSKVIPKDFSDLNHTFFLQTILVPNDIHDFSRNSYNQRTFNDIMEKQDKKNIDILKIEAEFDHSQTWEILHYLIEDHMLRNVKQLHIAMNIDKLEEESIYNWYRCLYNLFYKEGLRLYHTAASSPLCLQVTMMESCVYWLSWIRDPGAHIFVMHPPADFGTRELEDERLHLLISTPKVTCHNLQSAVHPSMSTIVMPIDKSIGICIDSIYYTGHCKAVILSNKTDVTLQYTLKKSGCKSVQLKPELPKISLGLELPEKSKIHSKPMTEVVEYLESQQRIDVISINYPGQEWGILTGILDSNILKNTSQLLMKIVIQDRIYGKHPVILRRMYSEIRRLETHGFQLFDSVPCTKHNDVKQDSEITSDCYKLGFMKKHGNSFNLKYMGVSPIGGF